MFSRTNMPSTTTVLSAYTSIATSTMIVRTIANEVQSLANQFIPQQLRGKIFEVLGRLYGNVASQFTLVVDEYDGLILNQMFEAAELYLRTKITPSIKKLRVSKIPTEKNLLVTVEKGQEIVDDFKGIQLTWKYSCTVTQSSSPDYEGSGSYTNTTEKKNFELSFHSKDKNSVLDSYLPYVLERSKAIKEENRRVKLYSLGFRGDGDGGGVWGSTNLDHPATFNTVAMDPKLKSELLEDLDRFVRRRDFYRRVGKAWKRGYLLYGPPGTGKSSLIAAMANYLNFNIYDLELANLHSNSELRRLLVSTANRSILVIEDIDCTIELQDRSYLGRAQEESDLTLSGILNFIDGLWSSCGDERIIVFTTNHKDRLDPALLRPGRMDMHVHMSYCTPCGFKLLASNYLMIQNHSLFEEIEGLIKEVNITPAEVAEELMKSDDADISLKSLISLLQKKKTECDESNVEDGKEADQGSKQQKIENEHENQIKKKRTKRVKY